MRSSAATMPPIEWPMRIVRTEGSIVGEGVRASTSMSMTFSCSLAVFSNHPSTVGSASAVPISKPTNAFAEISPRLIFRIHEDLDVHFREFVRDQVPKVLGELVIIAESVFTTLDMVVSCDMSSGCGFGLKRVP